MARIGVRHRRREGRVARLYRKLREQRSRIMSDFVSRLRACRAPSFSIVRESGPATSRARERLGTANPLSYFSGLPRRRRTTRRRGHGKLRKPDVSRSNPTHAEDERTRRLATEFACAWLHIYDSMNWREERAHFPTFTACAAHVRGDIRFFTDFFQRTALC